VSVNYREGKNQVSFECSYHIKDTRYAGGVEVPVAGNTASDAPPWFVRIKSNQGNSNHSRLSSLAEHLLESVQVFILPGQLVHHGRYL
jgi:hypothetical protein